MKNTVNFLCNQCGYVSSKWIGKCPTCEAWNSFSESAPAPKENNKIKAHAREPILYEHLLGDLQNESRIALGVPELDRVLGGGIVPGMLLLLTGEPGIGKSTLTLQIAQKMSDRGKKVLYVSGEESEQQVALRGQRLAMNLKNVSFISENDIETSLATVEKNACGFLIVDSIQVMSSKSIAGNAGSVSQVRLCTEMILAFAKPRKLPVLIIGHVTKDGTLAGPRVLEHLVDTVLYLEGDRISDARVLRGVKNRFGSVSEVGIFEMSDKGLSEVSDPASYFINERQDAPLGSVLTVTTEGSRPILLEVQALTNATVFGYPRRTATGFDVNRLQILIAVLQKHLKVKLNDQDVYVNIVGGYHVNDPSCDLAVCLAILSSFYRTALPSDTVAIGEVGLAGEIRIHKQFAKHEKQLKKLNFINHIKTVGQLNSRFFK